MGQCGAGEVPGYSYHMNLTSFWFLDTHCTEESASPISIYMCGAWISIYIANIIYMYMWQEVIYMLIVLVSAWAHG